MLAISSLIRVIHAQLTQPHGGMAQVLELALEVMETKPPQDVVLGTRTVTAHVLNLVTLLQATVLAEVLEAL